jgi:hypothetical protein
MRLFFNLISLFFLFSACVKNNPDPAWLQVNEWTISANPSLSLQEGELTENISDAWVYINDELIGVFQVPFKIPILKEGNVTFKIYPAIKNNGISATKKIYPFLKEYVINGTLVKNQVFTINPTTQYKDNLNFWIEDFEDASFQITDDPNTSAANIDTDNIDLQWFNGNAFGKVVLNSTDSTWIAYTSEQLNLPKGEECYLEIDYKVTNNVTTGLIYVTSESTTNNVHIRLNAQKPDVAVWKKIYIDLRELIGNSPSGSVFSQSFIASLDEGNTEGIILIDNIKVIHF